MSTNMIVDRMEMETFIRISEQFSLHLDVLFSVQVFDNMVGIIYTFFLNE